MAGAVLINPSNPPLLLSKQEGVLPRRLAKESLKQTRFVVSVLSYCLESKHAFVALQAMPVAQHVCLDSKTYDQLPTMACLNSKPAQRLDSKQPSLSENKVFRVRMHSRAAGTPSGRFRAIRKGEQLMRS